MEKKKEERERVGKKKRERKKGKRRQKHLRDGEKFPHCVRAKGESNGGDTEFSSNVFVANDNPPRVVRTTDAADNMARRVRA